MAYLTLLLPGWLAAGLLNYLSDWLPFTGPGLPDDIEAQPFSLSRLGGVLLHQGLLPNWRSGRAVRGLTVLLLCTAGWGWLFNREGATLAFWLMSGLFWALLLITVIDMEHRIIDAIVVLPTAVLALLYGALGTWYGWAGTLIGGLVGFGIVFTFWLGSRVFARVVAQRRGQALDEDPFGFGDVYLAGIVGLATAWPGVVYALTLAVVGGGLVSGLILIITRMQRRFDIYIPYGPFLVIGAVLMILWGPAIGEFLIGDP